MIQEAEVGYVVSSRNFLVHLDGLPSIQINDLVQSEGNLRGWVNALSADTVEVLMLDEGAVLPRQMFKKVKGRLSVAAGGSFFWR